MFRFIHTSDWHLGQSFINRSREEEHRKFLSWLLEQIQIHKVDALIVAGDIFDTGTPPSYARRLYYDFLKELNRQSNIPVIIIGGNHDSISTLNESGTLLQLLNIYVIGGKCEPTDEVFLIPDKAVICAVPFLRDRDVRLSVEGENFTSKKEALRSGIKKHYAKTLEAAKRLNPEGNLPIVATGHLTTTGGEVSDGVRDIYIGSLESYDANEFPDDFDYVALGHLHSQQTFGKRQHIRYCGSPIPISFTEAKQQKIVKLVEVSSGKKPSVQKLPIPTSRTLKSISGNLEEIQQQISALKADSDLVPWIEIVLNEDTELSSAQSLIKEFTKDLSVEILRFRRVRTRRSGTLSTKEKELTLQEISVEEVFDQKLSCAELDKDTESKLKAAFKEIHHTSLTGEDA